LALNNTLGWAFVWRTCPFASDAGTEGIKTTKMAEVILFFSTEYIQITHFF